MMFGDIGKRLLTMMGHDTNTPGAIEAEDIPVALDNLEKAINDIKGHEFEKSLEEDAHDYPNDSESELNREKENAIGIDKRALPLIEMLKAAKKANTYIMWK